MNEKSDSPVATCPEEPLMQQEASVIHAFLQRVTLNTQEMPAMQMALTAVERYLPKQK